MTGKLRGVEMTKRNDFGSVGKILLYAVAMAIDR
jgi:hypothetical protein